MTHSFKKLMPWFIGLSLVFAGGAFYVLKLRSNVNRVQPRIGQVVEAVYGLGTVIAPQTFQVKTAINQNISEIYVKEGDQVKAGALLMKFGESGINRAPFAGTVTSVPFKKGEILFPSTPALTLVNLLELAIEVSLEQQAVLRVKNDQKVHINFESMRGEKLEASVQSVFPRDGQFIVRIQPSRFPPGILPGMTADVAMEVGRKDNVLSIPVSAISSGKVTISRGGKTLKETVQIGVVGGDWAEVTSGNILADDEILVRSK